MTRQKRKTVKVIFHMTQDQAANMRMYIAKKNLWEMSMSGYVPKSFISDLAAGIDATFPNIKEYEDTVTRAWQIVNANQVIFNALPDIQVKEAEKHDLHNQAMATYQKRDEISAEMEVKRYEFINAALKEAGIKDFTYANGGISRPYTVVESAEIEKRSK